MSRNYLLLLAFVLGALSGWLLPEEFPQRTKVVTDLFIQLLQLIACPVIFLSLLSTFVQIERWEIVRSFFIKVAGYTLFTTIVAATVGWLLVFLLHPSIQVGDLPLEDTSSHGIIIPHSYWEWVQQIIPRDLLTPFLTNNLLSVFLLALMLGGGLVAVPPGKRKNIQEIIQSLFDAFLNIAYGITYFVPLATFGFTMQLVNFLIHHMQDSRGLFLYALCVLGANLIQGFVVLPLILKWNGKDPISFFRTMFPALMTAFFAKSSSGTLPITMQCAKKAGISAPGRQMSFPLCSVINMNGCAAFILITVLFHFHSYDIHIPLWEQIMWIFIATFAAVGNAGVPMGCFFLTMALLHSMGIPVALMGLVLPLYTVFDMVETALNVWSDSCVTHIADHPNLERKH